MAYNTFTLVQLEQNFGLQIKRQSGIFKEVAPVEISGRLRENLAIDTNMALLSGSEKARSEYLIAPILSEVYRLSKDKAMLFSGVEFNVDDEQGLWGFCDFLLTLAPTAPDLRAPVVSIVEAKKENINGGIPQCFAELIAAQIFNAKAERVIETLYGVVTTGEVWKFLSLQGTSATIDGDLYYLDNVEKIVGIIVSMLQERKVLSVEC